MSPPKLDRSSFDHVGMPTAEVRDSAVFEPVGRSWVSPPDESPAHIEWLRFEPDSPVDERIRTQSHVAFRVADLDRELSGTALIFGPVEVPAAGVRLAFIELDGAVVELIQRG